MKMKLETALVYTHNINKEYLHEFSSLAIKRSRLCFPRVRYTYIITTQGKCLHMLLFGTTHVKGMFKMGKTC